MFCRVAIIGLGLIGGSIGLALRNSKAAQEVIGYDLGKGVGLRARQTGAIDNFCDSLPDAVHGADLVIIATPVGAVQALLQNIASHVIPGTVITDVASTKAQVIDWAEGTLPSSVYFIGGHPMAGKEVSGVEAADADLFRHRIYCLTPTEKTHPSAVQKLCTLIEILGARVRFLDAQVHDIQVAAVSHLPFLASVALMNTVTEDENWESTSLLASSGFQGATRLAAGSPEMYRDICLTNSSAIVHWLDEYIAHLSGLRDNIATQNRSLKDVFAEAQHRRIQWQSTRE